MNQKDKSAGSGKHAKAKRESTGGRPGRSGRGGKGLSGGRNRTENKRTGNNRAEKNRAAKNTENVPVRLNRYIAQAGVCARRKADDLIKAGLVKVNDAVVTEMGIKVTADDVVEVNGTRITPMAYDYILLYKPTNVITTNQDEKDRQIVLDLIDDPVVKKKGLFPVGRLDRNTTGVLLLTNDGELAHRLMHPRYEIDKLYIVQTRQNVQPHEIEKLKAGLDIEGERYLMDEVAYVNLPSKNQLGVSLHEGKNRHIRKMLEALGHYVVRLERVQYAGLTTTDVRPGKWRRLKDSEIRKLRRLVKLR